MIYLERWWSEADESMKNTTRSLVKEGRLEIIHGGWVSNDEACPDYS